MPPQRGVTTEPSTSSAALREPARPPYAGVATRAIALATDAVLTIVLFTSVTGIAALIGSLVGGFRPEWLVGVLLACGWAVTVGAYFVLLLERCGADAGNEAAADSRDRPARAPGSSLGRALVRLVGLVLAIIPMFAGFVPVLFTERRRGLPDFLAGTVVLYDDARPATRVGTPLRATGAGSSGTGRLEADRHQRARSGGSPAAC